MAVPASEAEMPEEPARILVVEDEPVIRLYIAEALRDLGAMVVEAGTADEAWTYLATGGNVDLVFTDHRMPGSMTGTELAIRIRQTYPSLRVLLTSGVLDTKEWPDPIIEKPYGVIATAVSLIRRAPQSQASGFGRVTARRPVILIVRWRYRHPPSAVRIPSRVWFHRYRGRVGRGRQAHVVDAGTAHRNRADRPGHDPAAASR